MTHYIATSDLQHFTAGKSYPVLDYIEDNGILTTDDDNHEHYLSGGFLMQHFAKEDDQ